MGLFDKLFGSNKIKVEMFDNTTGSLMASPEMEPDKLPDTFELDTTLHLGNDDWKVEEAFPQKKEDFVKKGTLTLKLRKVEKINLKDVLLTLPTISNELPETNAPALHNDFEVSFHEDDWRQNEFLNRSSFPLVEIEIKAIKNIWENNRKETGKEGFNAFDKCHVRGKIGEPDLKIDFSDLKKILKVDRVGSLKLHRHEGYVQDGFSLQTDDTTYYGILKNNYVTEFGVRDHSDNSVEEIQKIADSFNLIFVSWYHAVIIAD